MLIDFLGHLQLTDYMSYDELLISALYAVACPTFFINNGERRNCGKQADAGTYESEGVFVGLVGARFEHADKMESNLMIVTPSCTESNGFGAKGDSSKVHLLPSTSKIPSLKLNFLIYGLRPMALRTKEVTIYLLGTR